MDVNQKATGFTLSAAQQVPGRIGAKWYWFSIAILVVVVGAIVSGIVYKARGSDLPNAKEDSQHDGAAATADSAAAAVVSNLNADRKENPPPEQQPQTQNAPDLSKIPPPNQLGSVGQYNSQQGSQPQQLSPAEQMRLASYQLEVQAMTTPLGQQQRQNPPFDEQPTQTPTPNLEYPLPNLKDALAPAIKSHAQPDENAVVMQAPPGALMIPAGTWIPATLEMTAASGIPGDLVARVSRDIFDARGGQRHLLIPLGTKLLGSYEGQIAYGQNRMAQIWNVIQYGNGSSIKLGDMNGANSDGSNGVKDRVNNHYLQLLRDAALVTGFAAGIGLTQRNQSLLSTQSVGASVSQNVGAQLSDLGSEMIGRNMHVPPTVEIGPGKEFFVLVKRSIIFAQEPFPTL